MTAKQWWKEAVVYQVYPRSFQDSNGDGIGDINGIRQRLDYIKKLGADVIWLCPVYESPNDDNGYDISDYQSIMREFGTMEDLDKLLEEAHSNGIRIIIDLVVNHTSDEHKWFIESKKSKDNPYRDYYIWREGKKETTPNNWGSAFGGSVWQYSEETDMYYLHIYSPKQPDLNWENQEVRNNVFEMMKWWLDKGIDGFRMDVISQISKPERLPDGILNGKYAKHLAYNGPHVHEYLKEMNEKVLSNYDIMTVGETPGASVEDARKYAGFDSKELNMVFQFEHMGVDRKPGKKWCPFGYKLTDLKKVMTKWQTGLNGVAWNSLYWNNHDQPRVVSRFGDASSKEYWEKSAKMLATCLHMMQGTPYIYQGEELGMTNVAFDNILDYRDIETLNAYKEAVNDGMSPNEMLGYIHDRSRDNARTPMQWDGTKNAGFTSGKPWIKINSNYHEINSEKELADPDSIFYYYQKLIKLRKQYPIIVYGDYEILEAENEQLYAYTRNYKNEQLLVLCNFSKMSASILFHDILTKEAELLICNYNELGELNILRPYEARVFKIAKK